MAQTATPPESHTLTFVSLYHEDIPKTRFLILLYTEALRRLGYTFKYVNVPARRASMLANDGEVDGELIRLAGYNAVYPDLVQVPARNYCFGHSAFSIRVKEPIHSWQDLAGKEYRVGVFRGMRFAEERLAELGPSVVVERVSSSDNGFRMLVIGRIDIFVTTRSQYYSFLETKAGKEYIRNQDSLGTIRHLGTWDKLAIYTWLNKSHQRLLEPIANQLRAMRREGLYDQYYDQAGLPPELKPYFLCIE